MEALDEALIIYKLDPIRGACGAGFFGGASVEETAEVLGFPKTVTRDWSG